MFASDEARAWTDDRGARDGRHGLTIDAFHASFDQGLIIKLLLPNQAAVQGASGFGVRRERCRRSLRYTSREFSTLLLARSCIDGAD